MLRVLVILLVALLCVAAAKPAPRAANFVELAQPQPTAPRTAKAGFKIRAGEAFPKFKLRNGKGKAVSHGIFKGHYTVVSYFFADCGPCIAEVPSLNSFASKHPETRVLAVTFDEADVAREFATKRGFGWPILAEGRVLFDAVGVIAVPTFVLVDPKGRVVAIARSAEIAAPKRQVDEPSLARWVAKKSGRDS